MKILLFWICKEKATYVHKVYGSRFQIKFRYRYSEQFSLLYHIVIKLTLGFEWFPDS